MVECGLCCAERAPHPSPDAAPAADRLLAVVLQTRMDPLEVRVLTERAIQAITAVRGDAAGRAAEASFQRAAAEVVPDVCTGTSSVQLSCIQLN